MNDTVSMLRLQADLISHETNYLELAARVCETNNLPETARNIRLSLIIFREASTLIRKEANNLEEQEVMGLEDLIEYDPADNGNQGS